MIEQQIKQLIEGPDPVFLNIGSGAVKGTNGWTTVDMSPRSDISWDLRKGIPFPNNSVDKVYSSHFLEHLNFIEAKKMIAEARRVLVDNGLFSLAVPNARLYIEAYMNPEINIDSYFQFKPAYHDTGSRMDYLNYIAFMAGHHKYLFDEQNLVSILELNGLKEVRLREFDPALDIQARDFESIYAEGRN